MASLADAAEPLRALIESGRVTPATRAVLLERLGAALKPPPAGGRCVGPDEFATLVAACARLLPPGSPIAAEAVAAAIDDRLGRGEGPGWRYDSLPPEPEAYRLGLRALDADAQARHAEAFTALPAAEQDALLHAFAGPGVPLRGIDRRRWFEMLLVDVTEAHVAQPAAQVAMGSFAFADAAGWRAIGLGEREAWEPDRALESPVPPLAPAPSAAAAPTVRAAALPPSPPFVARRFGESETVDAVIVGTGAGGGPLIAGLAEQGFSVVGFDAGPYFRPLEDFASDETEQNKLYWTDTRVVDGANPMVMGGKNSGKAVGGSTVHFAMVSLRFRPEWFKSRSALGYGADWPLDATRIVRTS